MLGAEFGPPFPIVHAVRRHLLAALVATPLAVDVEHSSLGMGGADFWPISCHHPRRTTAAWCGRGLALYVYHSGFGVLGGSTAPAPAEGRKYGTTQLVAFFPVSPRVARSASADPSDVRVS